MKSAGGKPRHHGLRKQKMPPRKKQTESALSVYADFAADVSDDALIAENFKLEDLIKAAQAKMDEWARPHKERVAQIEAEISRRLLERKADSTKTDSGTAYFSDIMNTKIENLPALFDYVADHWDDLGADVKLNLPIGTVRQHMDNNNGALPPGMTHSFFKRLNIKRS